MVSRALPVNHLCILIAQPSIFFRIKAFAAATACGVASTLGMYVDGRVLEGNLQRHA